MIPGLQRVDGSDIVSPSMPAIGLPRVSFGGSMKFIYSHQSAAVIHDERCLIRTKALPVV
jgi:hypothetical protein